MDGHGGWFYHSNTNNAFAAVHESFMAHFPRSLRCGDRVRLQSYFCRRSVAGSMRVHDPNLPSAVTRQRLAAGLSAELPKVQREALLFPSTDDEAGLLDQLLRGAIEMAPACEPAP